MKKQLFVIVILLLIVSLLVARNQIKSKHPVYKTTGLPRVSDEVPSLPQISSIDQVFADDHSWTATLSAKNTVTLIATGDILPARSVNFQTVTRNDFFWPYIYTADFVRNADITFINLETPLLDQCPLTQTGMIFCGDGRNIEGLLFIGTDIANLANNHTTNWQKMGVDETIAILKGNNISVTGIAGPLYKEIKGIRLAFLGYNDISKGVGGISDVADEKIKAEITEARKYADIVIVQYHWGAEYRSQPDARQKYLGRFTIDAGADLVIGNHPHWIQPVEFYKGKLITYAHGNYIFDQEWSLKTKQGVIGKYTFYDGTLVDVEYFPLLIENYGQARFYTGEEKQEILAEMKKESEILRIK